MTHQIYANQVFDNCVDVIPFQAFVQQSGRHERHGAVFAEHPFFRVIIIKKQVQQLKLQVIIVN